MTQNALVLQGVRVEREGKVILDVPALEVREREFLTVIGPNGSGKSTLLKMLALLDRPQSGRVFLRDKEVDYRSNLLPLRRKLAIVFQEPLLRDCSVLDNVATGLRFRGLPGETVRARAERWMDRFGISHLKNRSARNLSGGEAQRVSLARAFAIEPEILLLDEPFASLDAPSRSSLIEDFQHVLAASKVTTVLVTHDRTDALVLGDRLGVMMSGRLEQLDVPERVFAEPKDEAVAAFVGMETIITGQVVGQEDGLMAVDLGGTVVEAVGEHPTGRSVVVCLRPEHVTLSPVDGQTHRSSARNSLPGAVTKVSPLGPLIRVTVNCGFDLVATVTRQSQADLSLRPGARVVASFKATAMHVISKE